MSATAMTASNQARLAAGEKPALPAGAMAEEMDVPTVMVFVPMVLLILQILIHAIGAGKRNPCDSAEQRRKQRRRSFLIQAGGPIQTAQPSGSFVIEKAVSPRR
jgi:hypothetical protein